MTAPVTHASTPRPQANRSFLFAPGNNPKLVAKVTSAPADAVILDLEDAVAVTEKAAARTAVAAALAQPRHARTYVRINGLDTEFAFADVETIVPARPDGLVIPMLASAEQMATAEWIVTALEAKAGLEPGALDLIPIIETGAGLAATRAIARTAKRVRRIAFGAADFCGDMGMTWTAGEAECAQARAEIVLASRLAGLEPPIDSVWARLDDDAGLAASAARVRDMGFQGKMCIHPKQVAAVHAAFTPTPEQIAQAQAILAAFEQAEAQGLASIQLDGQFIDYPIAAKARQVLAQATEAGAL